MATFLSEVRGFTPLIDIVAEDVGMVGAVVYGMVWRYCRMSDGVCRAAVGAIAARPKARGPVQCGGALFVR